MNTENEKNGKGLYNSGVVSLDLCSVVSKVRLGQVGLGYGGLGAVKLS